MKKSYLLLGVTALLAVAALAAFLFGPQFEVRQLPPDLKALYLSADLYRKWRLIGGLLAVLAGLLALLAGLVWLNERKHK